MLALVGVVPGGRVPTKIANDVVSARSIVVAGVHAGRAFRYEGLEHEDVNHLSPALLPIPKRDQQVSIPQHVWAQDPDAGMRAVEAAHVAER
jgi:hypothetical protein